MNANAAYQVPVQQRRRRISRQEMLRRKRAIRRRKRIVCFLRVSFAIVLLLTAVQQNHIGQPADHTGQSADNTDD